MKNKQFFIYIILIVISFSLKAVDEVKLEKQIKEKVLTFSHFDVVLEVRETATNYSVPLFTKPSYNSPTFDQLKAGSLIHVKLSSEDYVKREKSEVYGNTIWREVDLYKFKRKSRKLYIPDNWKNLKKVERNSLGVPLTVRAQKKFDRLMLYQDIPLYLENDCTSELVKCIEWYEAENKMNLVESRFVILTNSHGQGSKVSLFYKVRISYFENKKLIWGDFWVPANKTIRLVDIDTCRGGDCVSQDLIANDPDKVASFFKKVGIVKKVAHKEQVVGSGFFMFHGDYEMEELGFNRWIDTLAKKYGVPYNKVPALSLFDVRPVFEASLGASFQSLTSKDDTNGDSDIKITGFNMRGKAIFPLFLDFEVHVSGSANVPIIQSNSDPLFAFDSLGHFYTPVYSSRGGQYVFLLGAGFSYRSFINAEEGVGYTSLFGFNLSGGYFTPDWDIYINAGLIGRDLKPESNGQEYALNFRYSQPWFVKRGWSLGGELSYFSYFDQADERDFSVFNQRFYVTKSF